MKIARLHPVVFLKILLFIGLIWLLTVRVAPPDAFPILPTVQQKSDALTPFHQTMLAEIAINRGQEVAALRLYMDMAKQTQDINAAERAMQIALNLRSIPHVVAASTLWAELDTKNVNPQLLALIALFKSEDKQHDKHILLTRLLQLDDNELTHFKKLTNELETTNERNNLLALLKTQNTISRPRLLLAEAFVQQKMGDIKASLALTEKALASTPTWEPAIELRIILLLQTKRPQEALRYITHIVKQNPNKASLRYIYASTLYANKQYTAAFRQFSWLIANAPEYKTEAIIQQAQIAVTQKQILQGYRILGVALQSDPGNIDLLYAHGLLAENLNEVDVLEANFKKILETHPEQANVLNILGYTLANKTTRYEEALEYIEKALELDPDNPMILDSMGWVLYRLKNNEEALNYLERAFALTPDAEIAAHLGEVLWVTGKENAARQIWQQALKQAPHHKGLQSVIQHFEHQQTPMENKNAVSTTINER